MNEEVFLKMYKTPVFVSFDFDNDKELKHLIIGQSKNPDSPFEVTDWSMKEAAPERNWEVEAEKRIIRAEVVLVVVGQKTYKAPGVLKEVAMAREHNKKIAQIIGRRDEYYKPVSDAGRLYSWSWENLKKIFQ